MDAKSEQIVNYVWINEYPVSPYDEVIDDKLCHMPLHYIDKALHNARRYTDAQFFIWIDKAKLDPMSLFWLDSYINIQSVPNISVRDLNEIPAFHNDERFGNEEYYCLWAKLDYARLLVLENLLAEMPWKQVFYCDFDANDIEINKDCIQSALDNWGMVIATTKCNKYENSFFGFSEKGNYLFSKLLGESYKNFNNMEDGYGALARFLRNENFIESFIVCESPVIAKKEMPVSLIGKIKPKKLHQSLGIC